jgi:hypothetical protein
VWLNERRQAVGKQKGCQAPGPCCRFLFADWPRTPGGTTDLEALRDVFRQTWKRPKWPVAAQTLPKQK